MPLPTARVMLNALQSGRLTINKIEYYRKSNDNIFISSKKGGISYNTVFDGTGGHANINHTDDPLLKSMLNERLITPSLYGGISVDSHTFIARTGKLYSTAIFSLGQISKGDLFSTNALWFNRECANKIAENIFFSQTISKAS